MALAVTHSLHEIASFLIYPTLIVTLERHYTLINREF